MLDAPDGLHTTRREAPPPDRQQPKAAFVLAEHPDGTPIVRWDGLLELGLTGGLEGRDGLRVFFVCVGRATLSLILKRVRTMV